MMCAACFQESRRICKVAAACAYLLDNCCPAEYGAPRDEHCLLGLCTWLVPNRLLRSKCGDVVPVVALANRRITARVNNGHNVQNGPGAANPAGALKEPLHTRRSTCAYRTCKMRVGRTLGCKNGRITQLQVHCEGSYIKAGRDLLTHTAPHVNICAAARRPMHQLAATADNQAHVPVQNAIQHLLVQAVLQFRCLQSPCIRPHIWH